MFGLKVSSNRIATIEMRKALIKRTLTSPYHQWIREEFSLMRAITLLFDAMDEKRVNFFYNEKEVLFLMAQGSLACAISSLTHAHLIICYPDLLTILKSASGDRGLAILAHELGHLYYRHSFQQIDQLQTQFEADQFAVDLGFKEGLIDLLSDYPESIECQQRLKRLSPLYRL